MKHFFLLLTICMGLSVQAQHELVFTNTEKAKVVNVKKNDLLKISFNGYLNQAQQSEGRVTAFTDSSIILSPRKKLFKKIKTSQTILLRDINGFKRYSNFRPAGEIIYGILSVGATGAVTAIIANANVSTAASFLATAATSTVTLAVRNIFLPTKVKNYLEKGWTMQLLPVQ